MTKDDIINRMQEAGLRAPTQGDYIFIHWNQLALLLAHEIEACAKIAEEWLGPTKDRELHIAAAIRARGNT